MESTQIRFADLSVDVRDFPDVESVYVIKPSDHNFAALRKPYQYLSKKEREESAIEVRAA